MPRHPGHPELPLGPVQRHRSRGRHHGHTTDGWILGEEVDGPEAWVEVAVNSDAFSERTVELFWNYLFRRSPYSCDEAEFEALWVDFRDGGRNVEEMLRALVLTEAYRVP